jgi:ABC-type multidrug transport system fused ATPase/permease subunit
LAFNLFDPATYVFVYVAGVLILLLDKSTSALDSEVEAAILDTLYEMMQGKT